MTKKVFRSIFIVASAMLLICLVVIVGVLYGYFTSIQRSQLETQTALIAQGIENEGANYFNGLELGGYRLTWVAADGTVLYDSEADAKTMENHAQREEIQEALKTGTGESERTSSTFSENTLYRAQRLSDGTVIRMSVTHYTVVKLILGMLQPICILLVAAIILSAVLASRLSKRIVEPLNALDLDRPLENDAYAELSPLLLRIEHQQQHINNQMDKLRQKQDEFSAVIGNMSEGLILLNEQGVILSINPAAAKLFGTSMDCIGRDMLMVDRCLAMQELIRMAQSGKHSEKIMKLRGGEHQVNASPVMSDGKLTGICILAFDITEKERAEKQRREFSANVSHELKTPLQSIMGSAELIENGLVKAEDMPRFIGHIRFEAVSLMILIDDIIRLSQLDEGGDMPRENVDLKVLAEEVANELAEEAMAKNIKLAVCGDGATINGVRRLLYEIIYNLCDNAIKYNVENGQVDVIVSSTADDVTLTVADTGIGISPEHQSRVFERFYRVDKSHSKETGGTGLGLSIVKHAAQYHEAKIELKSNVGKGTSICLRFPQK